MSKKKDRKKSEQGVYAMSLTVGAFVGLGLGVIAETVLLFTVAGLMLSGLVAYWITRPNKRRK